MTGIDRRRLLNSVDVDAPAVGQVAKANADATDTSVSQACEQVVTALDTRVLCEVDNGGRELLVDGKEVAHD